MLNKAGISYEGLTIRRGTCLAGKEWVGRDVPGVRVRDCQDDFLRCWNRLVEKTRRRALRVFFMSLLYRGI